MLLPDKACSQPQPAGVPMQDSVQKAQSCKCYRGVSLYLRPGSLRVTISIREGDLADGSLTPSNQIVLLCQACRCFMLDCYRFYHWAALMIWPRSRRYDNLCSQGFDTCMSNMQQLIKQGVQHELGNHCSHQHCILSSKTGVDALLSTARDWCAKTNQHQLMHSLQLHALPRHLCNVAFVATPSVVSVLIG